MMFKLLGPKKIKFLICSFITFIAILHIQFNIFPLKSQKIMAKDSNSSGTKQDKPSKPELQEVNKFKEFETYDAEKRPVNIFSDVDKLFNNDTTIKKANPINNSISEEEKIAQELEQLKQAEQKAREQEEARLKLEEEKARKQLEEQIINYEKIKSQYDSEIQREINSLPTITEDEVNWNGLDN